MFTHVKDGTSEMSHESTQEMCINNVLCVLGTCHGEPNLSYQTLENKSENLFDGNESQDPTLNGHEDRFGVEVCEVIVILAASIFPDEPFVEVLTNSTSVVDVCGEDSTHEATFHEVSDVDTASNHSVDCVSKSLHRSHEFQRHHLVAQLKVNDNQIATVVEHFTVARQILVTYGSSTPMTDEHYDGSISLTKFHTLREAI